MDVPKNWLCLKVTQDEAEAMHSDPAVAQGRPFGASNDAWLRLKSQLRSGDELWLFDSSRATGPGPCGNQGICIYRHGKSVAALLLKLI